MFSVIALVAAVYGVSLTLAAGTGLLCRYSRSVRHSIIGDHPAF